MTRESAIVVEHAIAPTGVGKDIGRRLYPTHDEIAQLAYSLYESRGRQEGHQLEDWLSAETGTRAALRVIALCRRTITTH